MNRLILAALASVGVLCGVGQKEAAAQYPYNRGVAGNPYQTPPVSPYFGLIGRGTIAQKYFNLTAPQLQFNANVDQLNQQIALNQQNVSTLAQGDLLLGTGHPSRFMNYQRYFLNLNATAAGLAGYGYGGGYGGYGGYGSAYGAGYGSRFGSVGGGAFGPTPGGEPFGTGASGLGGGLRGPARGGRVR